MGEEESTKSLYPKQQHEQTTKKSYPKLLVDKIPKIKMYIYTKLYVTNFTIMYTLEN